MATVWIVIGIALAGLLVAGWVSDRAVRRRGSRVLGSSDVAWEARESRRDAEILSNPYNNDVSWSSWSRRNRSGR